MKKFLTKILFALLLFAILVIGVFFAILDKSGTTNHYGNKHVFVWGDSQMSYGLDVDLLGKLIKESPKTSANLGRGVYDFLVCEKEIPEFAQVVASFSECALLRNPMSDYNRTGMELSSLKELFQSGCPLLECIKIVGINSHRTHINYRAFVDEHYLFAYSDTLDCTKEPLDVWPPMFEEKKEWFSWKAKAYEKGLKNLHEKGVRMVLVQLPFETQLESIANGSTNRHLSDSLKWALIKEFDMQYDTIVLKSDSLLMHDLSHLNEVGARLLTLDLADILQKDTINNRFLTVVIE